MLHREEEPDERKVIYLEFFAATSIFLVMALVVYMVFTYRPV